MTDDPAKPTKVDSPDDPPPILRSWPRLYATLLLAQLVIIIALWLLSEGVS